MTTTTTKALACENCFYWQPRDRTTDWAAPCELKVRARTDADFYCDLHSANDAVPAQADDAMQSQTRGGPPWANLGRGQWVKP